MSILAAIIALCIIIIIHELGHFSAAKLFDMKVFEFNLGMGPVIFKKRGKETVYAIRALPIGGSVLLGEDEEAGDDPREFRNKPLWQRAIVIVAGAFLNLVLGLILSIFLTATSDGISSLEIGGFREDGAVSNTGESGLQIGDKVVSINGMSVFSATDILYKLNNSRSKDAEDENFIVYEFVVVRNGEKVTLPNVKFAAQPNERGGMTYVRDFYVFGAEKTFFNVINYAFRSAVSQGRIIWLSLIDIIKGTYGLNDLSGPVGVVAAIDEMASQAESFWEKMQTFISISAFITINLGIVNLLPIPALDGARLLFFGVEAVRRKPLSANVEGVIHFVGFALLMLLMLVVTFNDIRKLILGDG